MSAVVGEVMLPAQREISGFGPVRSGVVTHALVLFFAIYFALGNIPRVLPIQVFRGAGIAASEPILYLLSALYIVIHINRIRFPTELFAASCILFLSTLWGILMHGLVAAPVFYSVRLAVAMISSFALGDALAQRYGGRLDQVLAGYIVLPLAVCTLIGWVIYLVFPDSVKLWLFLATLGIQFAGDPHSHRFISTFFDPQFFSCIVLMGILSVLALYQYKKASWHIPMLLFFGIALCLSLSRSGIATLLLVLATIGIFRVRLLRLSVKLVALIYGGIAIAVLSFPLYADIVLRLIARYSSISSDASAGHRLNSALAGLRIFLDSPVMGIGYNFLPLLHIGDTTALDSSLLSFLVTMGVAGLLALLVVMALFFARAAYGQKNTNICDARLAANTKNYLLVYLLIVVFFTSQFNNVLPYQFWLMPIMAMFSYFYCVDENWRGRLIRPELSAEAAA